MFSNKHVGVFAWIIFFVLMGIPIVNVILWIILLISPTTNRSLKNLLWAQIFVALIFLGLFSALGIGTEMLEVLRSALPF